MGRLIDAVVKWKPIKGFEGIYEVSTDGQIKNLRRNILMKPYRKGKYGHAMVGLSKNGKVTRLQVHRVVAETFIPNPENKPEVCHKSNKYDKNGLLNNSVNNLCWGTHLENCRYENTRKRQSENHADFKGKNNPNYGRIWTDKEKKHLSKLKGEQVIQWDFNRIVGIYDSLKQAGRETGVSWTNIRNVCEGLYENAGGYQWTYVRNMFDLMKGAVKDE